MASGLLNNGTDLDSILEPLQSGSPIGAVGITVGGTDISNRYAPVSSGLAYGTTNFKTNTTDIGTLFAKLGSTTRYYTGGPLYEGMGNLSSLTAIGTSEKEGITTLLPPVNSSFARYMGSTLLWVTGGKVYGYGTNCHGVLDNTPISWNQIGSCGTNAFPTAGVKSDGTLWTWSDNTYGTMGQNDNVYGNYINSPKQVGALTWSSVMCTSSYGVMAIRSDGLLFGWGQNYYGNLGQNNTVPYSSPVQIGASTWKSIWFNAGVVWAIRSDNLLFAWGNLAGTSSGLNNIISRSSPTQIGASTWASVKCSSNRVIGINTSGILFTWGTNMSVGNGLGTVIAYSSPVQVGASTWKTTRHAAAFNAAAHVIRSDGIMFVWGSAASGLNVAYAYSSPVQLGASTWNQVNSMGPTRAIRSDGTLWGFGGNSTNALGNGILTISFYSSPTQIGSDTNWSNLGDVENGNQSFDIVSKSTKIAYMSGTGARNPFPTDYVEKSTPWPIMFGTPYVTSPVQLAAGSAKAAPLTNVKRIFGHGNTLWALKNDNTLWGWGSNLKGELSQNTNAPAYSWTQIGGSWSWISPSGFGTVYGIKSDGTLWATGSGTYFDGTFTRSSAVQLGANTWSKVSVNGGVIMGRQTNGSLWSWGYGNPGAGGQYYDPTMSGTGKGWPSSPSSSPSQISAGTTWNDYSLGASHVLAVKSDGTLWGWGSGMYALGNMSQPGTYSWKQISASTMNLAIRSDNTLWAWGYLGAYGGIDGTYPGFRISSVPVQIMTANTWNYVSTNGSSAYAIRSDGILFAWGYNGFGQLGTNDIINRSSPTQIGAATWSKIFAGGSNACAAGITTGNLLFTWGNGIYGQTGLNTTLSRSSPTQVGASTWSWVNNTSGTHLAVQTNGTLWGWGNGSYGMLGALNLISKSSPVQIGASTWTKTSTSIQNFAGAIRSDGLLFTWGYNAQGFLGLSNVMHRSSPVQVGAATWKDIVAYYSEMQFLKTDSTWWTTGNSSYPGTSPFRSSPVQIGSAANYSSLPLSSYSLTNYTYAINNIGQLFTVGGVLAASTSIMNGLGLMVVDKTSLGTLVDAISPDKAYGWTLSSPVQIGSGAGAWRTSAEIPVQIGTDTNWSSVAAGFGASAALKTNGLLYTWGRNNYGQLGLGDTLNRSSPTQVGSTSWAQVYALDPWPHYGYFTNNAGFSVHQ